MLNPGSAPSLLCRKALSGGAPQFAVPDSSKDTGTKNSRKIAMFHVSPSNE
jgi:hypothetical protein